MNETILKGKWRQMKGAMKQQWGKLTDDDIKMLLGEGEKLVGRLQERYGYTQERAEREVTEFMQSLNQNSPFAEVRDQSAKTVRQHPWFAGIFFGAITLLLTGYMLNHFFTTDESQQESQERRHSQAA